MNLRSWWIDPVPSLHINCSLFFPRPELFLNPFRNKNQEETHSIKFLFTQSRSVRKIFQTDLYIINRITNSNQENLSSHYIYEKKCHTWKASSSSRIDFIPQGCIEVNFSRRKLRRIEHKLIFLFHTGQPSWTRAVPRKLIKWFRETRSREAKEKRARAESVVKGWLHLSGVSVRRSWRKTGASPLLIDSPMLRSFSKEPRNSQGKKIRKKKQK